MRRLEQLQGLPATLMCDRDQARIAVGDDRMCCTLEQRQVVDRITVADRDRVVPCAAARSEPFFDLEHLAVLVRMRADVASGKLAAADFGLHREHMLDAELMRDRRN